MRAAGRRPSAGCGGRHIAFAIGAKRIAPLWRLLAGIAEEDWHDQLTAVTAGEDIMAGHGVRGGKDIIATLRWRLIAVPGRVIRHARHLVLRLPPRHSLLPEVLARLRDLPAPT